MDPGTRDQREPQVARRDRRGLAVEHQVTRHTEARCHHRGGSGVIGLESPAGDERVSPFLERPGGDQRQLAHLVAAKTEANQIVTLDEQARTASEVAP